MENPLCKNFFTFKLKISEKFNEVFKKIVRIIVYFLEH